ncbi:uncharacterized protein Bfra_002310 [Botrytis fragariae]|uniref:Uncharacterized protein n=1 Tax=Botrytis fragariae TaxID=1964551 RepID=A0A8H6AYK4_9HELO|nr:uncharacterized protein Bfra_002310 [Botrytis fragariae]KAF5875914.1 hypothetical protein Bfra_002310 [Botrytis fragariae]
MSTGHISTLTAKTEMVVDCTKSMQNARSSVDAEEVPSPSSAHPQSNAGVHSPREVVSRKTVCMWKDGNGSGSGCGP